MQDRVSKYSIIRDTELSLSPQRKIQSNHVPIYLIIELNLFPCYAGKFKWLIKNNLGLD